MDRKKLQDTQAWVRSELERSVQFWLQNGMDHQHGGVYTCLDRKGEIYSTDKSVWMQGRCGWTFAYLCHVYGVKQEWLDASKSCIDFMEKYCINREAGDRMYFTVTEDGKPLRVTASARASTAWPTPSTTASPATRSASCGPGRPMS